MQLHLFWTPNFGNEPWRHEAFDTEAALNARYRKLRQMECLGEIEDLSAKYYFFHTSQDEAAAVRDVLEFLNRYDLCEMAIPQAMERQDDRIYFNRRLASLAGPQVMLKRGRQRFWLPATENLHLASELRRLINADSHQTLNHAPVQQSERDINLLYHDDRRFEELILGWGGVYNMRRRRLWLTDLYERVDHWLAAGVATPVND